MKSWIGWIGAGVALLLLLVTGAHAQADATGGSHASQASSVDQKLQTEQKPGQDQHSQPQQQPQADPKSPQGQAVQDESTENAENPKRIFEIIPNFATTNDVPANQRPMTVREKYILSVHQMFDFSAHIGNAFQSALQQASNGQPHYGQGWGAYGERFAASEGDQVTSSFFIFGFLPAVLHEDPRYFRRGRGSFASRSWYAITRTAITRKDSGEPTFNTPQVLGQLLQGAISTSYYPDKDRSVTGVFAQWGINLAYTGAYSTLREYYPDLLQWVFHRHRNVVAQNPSGTPPAKANP